MPHAIMTPISRRKNSKKQSIPSHQKNEALTAINFEAVNQLAQEFANHIETNFEDIARVLLEYESYEVVNDETARTLDLLKHLEENKKFFALRTGPVTSFLPKNQPLYALTCFVIVPSLMASEVHFRIPHSMRHFFPQLLKVLDLLHFFPNIFPSSKERLKFLTERSAIKINPKTEESIPITSAVIFTGTSNHAEKLRLVFDQRTLFIANGSGHNPIVVSHDADIKHAVDAALTLQLYNQGQDCAAPNAILVHKDAYNAFINLLRSELKNVRVGHYSNRECRVGPISEPEDLVRIQNILIDNRIWLDASTPGIIRSSDAIVEPTIISRPLKEGGNFTEVFAPIFFVQKYEQDYDLSEYFESRHYPRNAMYVTLYGTSNYVDSIIGKIFESRLLHDRHSLLRDTHLHALGQERGTQPYGGCGYAASNYSINGKIICRATLPQREIYENIARPILLKGKLDKQRRAISHMNKLATKDVRKLLGIKVTEMTQENSPAHNFGKSYLDGTAIMTKGRRYLEVGPDQIFSLLSNINVEHIPTMEPKHVHQIRSLHKYLKIHQKIKPDAFETFLYALSKSPSLSDKENKSEQLKFFQHIYQLLLGKNSGPRLVYFLVDADRQHILQLLDI